MNWRVWEGAPFYRSPMRLKPKAADDSDGSSCAIRDLVMTQKGERSSVKGEAYL